MRKQKDIDEMINPVPEGYMRDGRGALVPLVLVKPIDIARNDLVLEMIEKARALNTTMRAFKAAAFGDIAAFVDLSAQQYGVQIGGEKGNITLLSFDGRYKVTRNVQPVSRVDEQIQAAKALIDQCIMRWSQGSDVSLVSLVNQAFEVDKEGNFSVGRLMMLRKAAINEPDWILAMEAIANSIDVYSSASYVRFYERVGDTDNWTAISLDIAKL